MPTTLADRTRRVYDRLAAVYPVSTMFFHSRAHRCALGASELRDGMKVLEVATGSGRDVPPAGARQWPGHDGGRGSFAEYGGPHAAHRASSKYPLAKTHCQAVDARHMPFRNEAFDAIFCCYLLELLSTDDIAGTLSEVPANPARPRQFDAGADRAKHSLCSTLFIRCWAKWRRPSGGARWSSAFPN